MRFFCINDGVPEETTRLLSEACAKRAVPYVEVPAPRVNLVRQPALEVGDLLFRPAVSAVAVRVERILIEPGVATFYRDEQGAWLGYPDSILHVQRQGMPVVRCVTLWELRRTAIERYVAWLGGFPLVVKVRGYSRGVGVIRVDSAPSLYSVVDYVLAQGATPLLCAYVDAAVHWRLVVVGARVVAAYRNRTDSGDFRTYAGDDPEDYTVPAPEAMRRLAVRATASLGLEHAGVDVLAHPSGRLFFLEANFPCYFATAQEAVGTDVAGSMVEHLMAKSRRGVAT